MTTITIPADRGGAIAALQDLGSLVTATNWHRAALVASLVGPAPGMGRRGKEENSSYPFTTTALEALGIVGLRTNKTIERYRDAWFDVAKQDAPTLGQTVSLDGLPEWPPTRTGTDGYSSERGAEATIRKIVDKHGTGVLTGAIRTDPATAAAAAEALASTAQGRVAAWDAIREATPIPEPAQPRRETTQSDLMIAVMKVHKADNDLITAVRQHKDQMLTPEVDIITNTVRRMRAAADFVEAMASGQTVDEELMALLNEEGS